MLNMTEKSSMHSLDSESASHESDRPKPGSSLFIQTLKQAALRISEIRRGKSLQTRELVALLASHAARNRRIVQPRAMMRMCLPVISDKVTVRITIKN